MICRWRWKRSLFFLCVFYILLGCFWLYISERNHTCVVMATAATKARTRRPHRHCERRWQVTSDNACTSSLVQVMWREWAIAGGTASFLNRVTWRRGAGALIKCSEWLNGKLRAINTFPFPAPPFFLLSAVYNKQIFLWSESRDVADREKCSTAHALTAPPHLILARLKS